ncbi:hypothetical protein HYQ46_002784 [Verticillium longisporum]|nr:hypothetical protein HYQ46_002784 [Verticillium longisporum]
MAGRNGRPRVISIPLKVITSLEAICSFIEVFPTSHINENRLAHFEPSTLLNSPQLTRGASSQPLHCSACMECAPEVQYLHGPRKRPN